MCGGTWKCRRKLPPLSGLSPRVRGNPRPPSTPQWPRRSIPACAGEPSEPMLPQFPGGVYPRVCGGTIVRRKAGNFGNGLSPRVRGNRRQSKSGVSRRRSIPACAGEPRRTAMPGCGVRVYPRVCGGTPPAGYWVNGRPGLSPRVRGNLDIQFGPNLFVGSIPACAGEPQAGAVHHPQDGVYPRVCGGTRYRAFGCCSSPGLSPRVRGNPGRAAAGFGLLRSIPACAGEPGGHPHRNPAAEVYPRVCGGTPTARWGRNA